ncbi:MAG: hypothetical protein HKN23_01305 [Verrucomicrobiales bacterium]|nr:hypothetical protein [Verrucomicrobiales bacterium]
MKSTVITLLIAILVVGIANIALVIMGGGTGGGSDEYLVVDAARMDEIGFASIAREDNLEPDEDGNVTIPRDKLLNDPRAIRANLLPRTLKEIESQGWEFVSVTRDFDYIFRKK